MLAEDVSRYSPDGARSITLWAKASSKAGAQERSDSLKLWARGALGKNKGESRMYVDVSPPPGRILAALLSLFPENGK